MRAKRILDRLVLSFSAAFSVVPLASVVLIAGVLIYEALPAIRFNGLKFFYTSSWRPGNFYANVITTNGVAHPPGADYGVLFMIVGTLLSSVIAMLIAIPVGILGATFVTRFFGSALSSTLGVLTDVLAGVPSVVFGLWGSLSLGPILARDVYPHIEQALPNVAIFKFFKGATGSGNGLLTSGVVLAVMVLPIVFATTRELLVNVPESTREGATALGMTKAEVLFNVDYRWVSSGIFGACILGLGRALGETMAIAMISGAAFGKIPANIYSAFVSIAAAIVSQLDAAFSDASGLAVATLAEAASVLLVISIAVNSFARLLIKRVSTSALPVGRGI